MPLTIGTSYFPSVEAARAYYRPYGYTTLNKAVQQKLDDGEIHIGKPPLKDGQRLITLDGGLRYGIVERETETHAEHAKRRNISGCSAHHVNFGGGCLNCGWTPKEAK